MISSPRRQPGIWKVSSAAISSPPQWQSAWAPTAGRRAGGLQWLGAGGAGEDDEDDDLGDLAADDDAIHDEPEA